MRQRNTSYKYWAFISYSSKDVRVAKKLHRRLETYRIPRDLVGRPGRDTEVPKKIFPVFRDRDELPLSSDLGASIEDALRASRYLIVLCSPHAAKSQWVNEEVRYFKAIGREDRILAIILDGEPHAAEESQECFPTALKLGVDADGAITSNPAEPIGGDLRPGGDGWNAAFLKAVAGITGMGYDSFARRAAKRQRRQRLVAAAGLLLLLGIGLWYWDYNRLKVGYYAQLSERWGVPMGVVPLDAATRAGRQTHYRIESRRNKVRRVVRANSRGMPVNDEDGEISAAITEINYGEDGSLQQLEYRDRGGKLVRRHQYSDLRDGEVGKEHFIELKQQHQDAPLALVAGPRDKRVKSEITAFRVTYDGEGRPVKRMYLNVYRAPRAKSDGTFGHQFNYDEVGLQIKKKYLNSQGVPHANKQGIVEEVRQWDERGNRVEQAYFGTDGKPVSDKDGVHKGTSVYDGRGNLVERAYLGTEGEPVGIIRIHKYVYDKRGNEIEVAYFGIKREPVIGENGVHKYSYVYDERGNPIEMASFGTDGKPVLDNTGVHKWTGLYDERRNQLESASFGTKDESVLGKEGYHKFTWVYDERENPIEMASFGTDGMPILDKDGVHKGTSVYDERNNEVEIAYFGLDGDPVFGKGGFHKAKFDYDDRGSLVEWSVFDLQDEPFDPGGGHRTIQLTNGRGLVIERTVFGPDQQPACPRIPK